MARKTLTDYSPAVQQQIVAQLHPVTAAPTIPAEHRAYPLSLWLNYRVPSLNTVIGGGRWTKAKHDRKAAEALNSALSSVLCYPRQGSGRLHVIVTCYCIQPRDADNPCVKFLNDQLRKCGILRNDDPGSMALTVNPDVRVSKRALEGTRVVIVEALP